MPVPSWNASHSSGTRRISGVTVAEQVVGADSVGAALDDAGVLLGAHVVAVEVGAISKEWSTWVPMGMARRRTRYWRRGG